MSSPVTDIVTRYEMLRNAFKAAMNTNALVAFVDIANSTALSSQSEDDYVAAIVGFFVKLEDFFGTLREAQQIRVAKTRGDGAMLVKMLQGSSTDWSEQVCAFCEAMVDLVECVSTPPLPKLDLKVGIGHGEKLISGRDIQTVFMNGEMVVPITEDDVWGLNVNLVARIESLATGAQVLVDGWTAELLKEEHLKSKSFRLIINNSPVSEQRGYPFRVKGYPKDLFVNQLITNDRGVHVSVERHLLSNYLFAAMVLLRVDNTSFFGYQRRGASPNTVPTEAVKRDILDIWRNCFSNPLGVGIYFVRQETFLIEHKGALPQDRSLDKWHLLAIVTASDLSDYARRMELFIGSLNENREPPFVEYSITIPLVRTDAKSYQLSVVPAFNVDGVEINRKLPATAWVRLSRYGTFESPTGGNSISSWRSIGMFDWVEICEMDSQFAPAREGLKWTFQVSELLAEARDYGHESTMLVS